jgi:hypothetical protein
MKKIRLLEVTDRSGRKSFLPQKRFLFFFWKCKQYDEGIMSFNTLGEARKFYPNEPVVHKSL